MDRTHQYVFGGLASGALIAAAVAAFVTITSLVAGTDFPDGRAVPPPSGPHAVSMRAERVTHIEMNAVTK